MTGVGDPIAALLVLAREGDLFAAIERIESEPDAERAATLFGQLAQRLYAEKDVSAAVAIRRAGIQFCLCREPGFPQRAELRSKAKALAYNLGADLWPGWNDGVVLTRSDLDAGMDAARLNLRLARELGRGALAESKAHWLLGAHWLARGEHDAARSAFERARELARAAGDRDQEDLNAGYVALVGALTEQPGANVELERVVERFEREASESARFYSQQLRTALEVFRRGQAPTAAS